MGIRRRSAFQAISSFKGAKRGMIQKNKQLSSEILRLMENNPFAGTQIKINRNSNKKLRRRGYKDFSFVLKYTPNFDKH